VASLDSRDGGKELTFHTAPFVRRMKGILALNSGNVAKKK